LGAGIPQDNTQAYQWYKRSAEAGDAEGQYWLAEMYIAGRGVLKDPVAGKKWMTESARQDFDLAKKWLQQETKGGAPVKHTR